MIYILLRILACMAVIAAPFVLLALASGKGDGLLWLIFPVVLAIPALMLLALVFAPVEAIAAANNFSRTLAVLIAGAIGAAVIWLGLLSLNANSQGKPIMTVVATGTSLKTTIIWMALAMLLGLVWRASEWLARAFGWIGNV